MANYKTSHKVYSAWNYMEEVEDLNRQSEQGWQLVKGGCFSSRFEENPNVRYRYQLDFGKVDNIGRYIETFREQGWEYINSTFNGWHYFRKLYDPSLPEEEYEIFTDTQSLAEMQRRWAKIALGIGIALFLFAVLFAVKLFRQFNIPNLISVLLFLVESSVLTRDAAIMRDPSERKSRKSGSTFLAVFFAVIVVGAAAMITLAYLRPGLSTTQRSSTIDAPIKSERWTEFEIKYADYYYLDLEMRSEKPMTYRITDDAGNVFYEKTEADFKGENIGVRLKPGHYWNELSADEGFSIDLKLQ